MRRIIIGVLLAVVFSLMTAGVASAHVLTTPGTQVFVGDGSAAHHAGPNGDKGLHNACMSERSEAISFGIPNHGC